ncbi:ABC transporter permease [Bacillus sp. RG28]|uniref:ABC transporter permease n=1 Tax=Gottfriedia endophytica TaxID=2820819 RepID=A0A940NKC6_9BACI|nr:ABC transporter permease [Gottfriedia endophytica]MBP0723779.1 ABC transporter permease [Gottfriedia endophytica]
MRVFAIAKRIIKQFLKDKRSLAMIFVAPIVLLFLFSYILQQDDSKPTVALFNVPSVIENGIKDYAKIVDIKQSAINKELKDKKIDGAISFSQNQFTVKVEGTDGKVTASIMKSLQDGMKKVTPSPVNINIDPLYGKKDMSSFDTIGPVFIGFFSFLFVFILAGISFVRERLTTTLERLLVTPVKRWEIVFGYILGFGFFALIQSLLITIFSINVLNMYNVGAAWQVCVVNILLSLTALTLGMLLSAYAHNEFQVVQFIPVIVVPQLLFSGIFSTAFLPNWFQYVGKVLPLTYGAEALRGIMIKGQSLTENIQPLGVLLIFSLCFVTLNIFVLKKQRSI